MRQHNLVNYFNSFGKKRGKREVEGLIEAVKELKFNERPAITFDQEDNLPKDGKAAKIIPGWKGIG